jgi:hypothetical protein
VAPLHSPANKTVFDTVVAAVGHAPGVVTSAGSDFFPAGPGHTAVALVQVYRVGSPQDQSTVNLINDLRHRHTGLLWRAVAAADAVPPGGGRDALGVAAAHPRVAAHRKRLNRIDWVMPAHPAGRQPGPIPANRYRRRRSS